MNELSKTAISFVDKALAGKVVHALEKEQHKFRDTTIHTRPVCLEPEFDDFDMMQPYSRVVQKDAVGCSPVKHVLFEIHPPLLDIKTTFIKCEKILTLQSCFSGIMSYEVTGNTDSIRITASCPERYSTAYEKSWGSAFEMIKAVKTEDDPFAGIKEKEIQFVDLYTQQPYYRKMTDYSLLLSNPAVTFMRLLSQLKKDEFGFMQVLFLPCKADWIKNIEKFQNIDLRGSEKYGIPRGVYYRQLKTYGEKRLFAVKVRIGCTSEIDLLKEYTGMFQYGGRPFQFTTSDDYTKKIGAEKTRQMLHKRISYTTGFLVSSDELCCLTCLPDTSITAIGSINIDTIDNSRIILKLPDELKAKGRKLGINNFSGKDEVVVLPDSQKNKSMYIIGTSTYGKTTSMIHQFLDVAKNNTAVFIDPHGDAAQELLGYIDDEDKERVVYFNPAFEDYSPDYCPFITDNEGEIGRLTVDFVTAFESLFDGHVGMRFSHILGKIIYALFLLNKNLTSIPILLSRSGRSKQLIKKMLSKTKNLEIRRFFQHELFRYRMEALTPVINKVSNLFLDERLSLLFSRTKNRIDVKSIIKEKKIFIASLPMGILGGSNVAMLGSFLISQFQKAAYAQAGLAQDERKQIYLFIDEFHRFPVYTLLSSIINEARKHGLHLTLAHQETGQIHFNILKALCSIPNVMCFNVNIQDARNLSFTFANKVSQNDISSLGVGEVYSKISNKVTFLKTFPPREDFDDEVRQRIIDYNLQNYYTPISELKKKIEPKKREYDKF